MGTGKRRILTEEVSIFDHLISWTSKPEVNELKPVQLALQSVVSVSCSTFQPSICTSNLSFAAQFTEVISRFFAAIYSSQALVLVFLRCPHNSIVKGA